METFWRTLAYIEYAYILQLWSRTRTRTRTHMDGCERENCLYVVYMYSFLNEIPLQLISTVHFIRNHLSNKGHRESWRQWHLTPGEGRLHPGQVASPSQGFDINLHGKSRALFYYCTLTICISLQQPFIFIRWLLFHRDCPGYENQSFTRQSTELTVALSIFAILLQRLRETKADFWHPLCTSSLRSALQCWAVWTVNYEHGALNLFVCWSRCSSAVYLGFTFTTAGNMQPPIDDRLIISNRFGSQTAPQNLMTISEIIYYLWVLAKEASTWEY